MYVEPEYQTTNSLYSDLMVTSAQVVQRRGARFATATTRGADPYLNRLYEKWCDQQLGSRCTDLTQEPSSLFVFDIEKMLGHPLMQGESDGVSFGLGGELEVANQCVYA